MGVRYPGRCHWQSAFFLSRAPVTIKTIYTFRKQGSSLSPVAIKRSIFELLIKAVVVYHKVLQANPEKLTGMLPLIHVELLRIFFLILIPAVQRSKTMKE